MSIADLFIIAPNWKQPQGPLMGEWSSIQQWDTTQPWKRTRLLTPNSEDECQRYSGTWKRQVSIPLTQHWGNRNFQRAAWGGGKHGMTGVRSLWRGTARHPDCHAAYTHQHTVCIQMPWLCYCALVVWPVTLMGTEPGCPLSHLCNFLWAWKSNWKVIYREHWKIEKW